MEQALNQLRTFAVDRLPGLVLPIAILIVGWLLAVALGALARRALRKTKLDDRLAKEALGEERAKTFDSARWGGKLVYYVVLLVTAVAFLQSLRLTAATAPISKLLEIVFAFVPKLLGAGAIAFFAWLVASVARRLMRAVLGRWDLDRRVAHELGSGEPEGGKAPAEPGKRVPKVGDSMANTTYWIVLLLFVPAVLDALGIQGLLTPVQHMVDEVLAFLPNLASAGLILAVGWVVARILQRTVTHALEGVGADRLGERAGVSSVLGKHSISSLLGLVVYALILIPVAIGALNALQLEAITRPASEMLGTFFGALPMMFAALVVVAIAYVAARLLYSLTRKLLEGIGFDDVFSRLEITAKPSSEWPPSRVAGAMVMVAVMLFAAIEASRLLGFVAIAALADQVAVLGGHILLGLVIIGIGLYAANVAARAVRRSSVTQPRVLSMVARVAVLGLAGAMGLRQMGIADAIIELAFGLVLGAAAVAAALAFGLGGRDAAGRAIDDMRARLERSRRETTPPPHGATPNAAE
jgi:hypothetical protein